jgi:hypothetical protein
MKQMSLSFEPGLAQRHRSLVECVATGIYKRGLGRIAAMVDEAPSHLSAQLSGDGRRLAVETLEAYIDKTGDLEPIYYLIDKFMGDPETHRQEALARVDAMLKELPLALAEAGLAKKGRR